MSKLILPTFLLLSYGYILYPRINFPQPPPDALQSGEEADTESFYRRAYFTDFSREEVINHYAMQFDYLPTLRLNYPPEDAQTIIRDQTRSTYLEELVHPLRESIYINGFEPKDAKDDIWYRGQQYQRKITVKYVPGDPLVGILVVTASMLLTIWLFKEINLSLRK